MPIVLSDDVVDTVQLQIHLRQKQLEQIETLFQQDYPSPSNLVVHGSDDLPKAKLVEKAFQQQNVDYAVVNCKECLSQRHLLNKIFTKCLQQTNQTDDDATRYGRVDSVNALFTNLYKLFGKRQEKFVIIIADIDQQKGVSHTLLPALAHLGELLPYISVTFTSSSPRPLDLHKGGIAYIYVPTYKRDEAIQIVLHDLKSQALLPTPQPSYCPSIKQEKLHQIYAKFVVLTYDTLVAPTTNNIAKFKQTCRRLWPRFIWPFVSGEAPASRASTKTEWDFAKLLTRNRTLFQADGEEALQERLLPFYKGPITFPELIAAREKALTNGHNEAFTAVQPRGAFRKSPLLSYFTTLLLLSAYLASHTPQKHDIVLFSRLSNNSTATRRRKRKLARSHGSGMARTPSKKSPTKKSSDANENADGYNSEDMELDSQTPQKQFKSARQLGFADQEPATPSKERTDRSMLAVFERTSNVAKPFVLERLIAILRAVWPEGVGVAGEQDDATVTGEKRKRPDQAAAGIGTGVADRVYVELAELERLRLVVRERSGRSGGVGIGDADQIMEEKWRCAVSREWVVQAGREYGVGLDGYEIIE